MSMPQKQLFETVLAIPQTDRADLVFQLLQSLGAPGEELSDEEFKSQLQERVAAYHSGELKSFSIEETRSIVNQRLSDGQAQ